MSPFKPLLRELSKYFPDSWIHTQGWRLSGLPHSRLWLRIDQRGDRPFPTENDPATWQTVRIDIKAAYGRETHDHVAILSDFENAQDAAEQVRVACQNWMEGNA